MDVTSIVSENVKRLREQRKLTLDAAAEATGVSRSMLSQIEKGDVNPTISVLWKIAGGFKVSFGQLIERHQEDIAVIRRGDIAPLVDDEGRYVNYPTFFFGNDRPFEGYQIAIAPGGALAAQPHLPDTEEYVTVFAGALTLTVDGKAHSLSVGDSIRFLADVPHRYCNPGDTETQLAMLIYYRP